MHVVDRHPASVSAVPPSFVQALDAAPVGIAILDVDLTYRYVNPAMAALNRLPVREHLGRRLPELFPGLDEAIVGPIRAVAAGGPDVENRAVSVPDPARPDVARRFLVTHRRLVGADGAVEGVITTATETTDAWRNARYVGALQALASALGAAASEAAVADAMLDVAVPTLGADRGAVSILGDDGQLVIAGSTGYRDGELTPARVRRAIDADDPLAEVARTGGVLVFETGSDLWSRYPRFERRRASGGAIAAVGMPPGDQPVGGAIIAWPAEQPVPDEARSFLQACSRLAGQALERVRSEARARRRAEGLARTLAAVAGEVEPAAIAQALLREAMPGVRARWGAVRVLTADGASTRLLWRDGFGPDVPAAEDLPLETDAPSVEAIREGREVLVPDLVQAATLGRWPDFAPGFVREGQRASMSVPMLRDGAAIGCVTLGFEAAGRFDDAQLAYVRSLAEATTAALERARLTDAEARSRRLLGETLDQLPIGVFIAEPPGNLVFQSQEVAQILGVPMPLGALEELGIVRRSLEGQPLGVREWPLARALRGETVEFHESVFERPDGRSITIRTTAKPVQDASGRIVAAVSVFTDVTRERAAAEAREAFLGVLSHELRTPVTAIYGGSVLLARHRGDVPAALDAVVEDVAAESLRLMRLVEDLLVIARVERGLPVAEREPLLVAHVLRRVLAEEGRRWPDVTFTADIAPSLPTVLGDAGQLEVVLRNLIGNAAKYAGGAHVSARRDETGVCITVEDEGPGLDMAPEQLFRLFQRGRSASKRASGSGIGLFVCRALVEGMGGRIWAGNRESGGAAFHVHLSSGEDDDPA